MVVQVLVSIITLVVAPLHIRLLQVAFLQPIMDNMM